jgi:hypothetical protein
MKEELLKNILLYTVYISLCVQILSGIFDIFIIIIKKESNILLLKLLFLELLVQIIEGIFYTWLIYYFSNISNVTPKRYLDWFISTPIMLFITCVYLEYIRIKKYNKEIDNKKIDNKLENYENLRKEESPTNLYDILLKYKSTFLTIFLLNALMLIFGYLGEINVLPVKMSVFLGFIPFSIYFIIIYNTFAKFTFEGKILFYVLFIIWALYGISALFSYYFKNIFYNILDIIAKNFFILFLGYMVLYNK